MAQPLKAIHLLEKIFHAIFVQQQQDRPCPCKRPGGFTRHSEIFDFEPVPLVPDEWTGAKIRVQDLKTQLEKWTALVKDANDVFQIAYLAHRPILDRIKAKLDAAGERLY